MNWLRKTIVPAVLLLAVSGYFGYSRWQANLDAEFLENCAQATAQIWVATVAFRDDEDQKRLLLFRDSVLIAHGLTTEEIEAYSTAEYEEPEKYHDFVARVGDLVDSLIADRTGSGPEESADSTKTEQSAVP